MDTQLSFSTRGFATVPRLRHGWLLFLSCILLSSPVRGEEKQASVVFAPRRRAVLSSEAAARVQRIHKQLGEAFEAGAVLVELESAALHAALRVAESRLQEARARASAAQSLAKERIAERRAEAVLQAARANLDASEALHKDRQASAVDLARARRDVTLAEADLATAREHARTDLASTQREVVVAEAEVEEAKRHLAACTITAPFAGRVVRVRTREHERAEVGQPLVEIVQDTELLAKFLMPSAFLRSVKIGKKVPIRITETGERVTATVLHIAAELDPASVTFEVHATISNPDRRLQGGLNGEIDLAEFEPK